MRKLMAGVAAIALVATGAVAQNNGKGNGNKEPAAAQQKGDRKDNAKRGNGNGAKADRGQQRVTNGARGNGKVAAKTNGNGNGNAKSDRGPQQREAKSENRRNSGKANGNGNAAPDRRVVERTDPDNARRDRAKRAVRPANYDRDDRRDYDRYGRTDRDRDFDWRWLEQDRARTFVKGCPPGLAKKRNGCNPPGQLKGRYYDRSIFGYDYRPRLFGLTNYRNDDYYYRDGYLVRYGNNSISSWIPLLGGALGIGNLWPDGYSSYDVPDYYVDYYDLGGTDRYRYADNVIYRMDPQDAAISSIAALITGDQFVVGQPMPSGYDVYNVPYSYRDRYYDTPQSHYRYSDGRVYQIDPETQLIAAVIDLLV